jgi:formate/nitrite transporter FocA (FNT family)
MNTAPENGAPTPASKTAGSALMVATFGLLAVLLVCLALYQFFEAKEPASSPRVWVALVGAVYVGWRAWMIYSRNKNAR